MTTSPVPSDGDRRTGRRSLRLGLVSCVLFAAGAVGIVAIQQHFSVERGADVSTSVLSRTTTRDSARLTACESSLDDIVARVYQSGIAGVPAQTLQGPIDGTASERLADCERKVRTVAAVLGG